MILRYNKMLFFFSSRFAFLLSNICYLFSLDEPSEIHTYHQEADKKIQLSFFPLSFWISST